MGITELDEQLEKLRTKLRDLSSTYKDQYPEIRELKDQIAKAEAQRDQQLAALKTKRDKPQADTAEAIAAYPSFGSRDSSSLAQLQSQLQANDVEIKNREQSIAALSAQINRVSGATERGTYSRAAAG